MTIYQLLRNFLLDDGPIASLVATRIYPVVVPQAARYPAISIQLITDVSADHLRGTGMGRPRFQIEAISRVYDEALDLAGLIRARLDAFTGIWTDESVSPPVNYPVAVQRQTATELFEGDVNGGFYRHVSDWFIQHQGKMS